jgi:D-3-phosphoglycerate dehydrogenase
MTMKVLITPRSFGLYDGVPVVNLYSKGLKVVRNETGGIMSEADLKAAIAGVDGVIVGVDPLTADVMSAAPGLKAVAKYGVGMDNIDLGYCEEHGVKVSKTVGANTDAVADYTFALMLALARDVISIDRDCRDRDWTKTPTLDVAGRALGLVGLGAIGKAVARRARGFGMSIIAYDVDWDADFAAEYDVRRAQDIGAVMRKSDFVSLHLPLTEETKHIIDADMIKLMRTGAFIVNTARGGLIDEDALLDALLRGIVGGAGIDVFEEEPPSDERWYDLPHIILGSHCAASTVGAIVAMSAMAVDNLIRDLGV